MSSLAERSDSGKSPRALGRCLGAGKPSRGVAEPSHPAPGYHAPSSLVDGDTFVPSPQAGAIAAESASEPATWCEKFDASRIASLTERAAELKLRREAMSAAGDSPRAQWAAQRERACRTPVMPKVNVCGEQQFQVECACGPLAIPLRCGQTWVCEKCRRARATEFRKKVEPSLRHHVEHAPAGWWLVLITWTVRHSGDVRADHRRLVRGMRAVRKWLRRYLGKRAWRDHHHAIDVVECTPGRAKDGHVHAHTVAVLPFLPLDRMRAVYVRATEGQGQRLDYRTRPKKNPRGRYTVGGAVGYLAKYASKGVELGDFPPELAGRVAGAMYEQRKLSVTHGFYVEHAEHVCPKCNEPWCKVSAWQDATGVDLRAPISLRLTDGKAVGRSPPAGDVA